MSAAEETNPYAAPTSTIRERRRSSGPPLASLVDRFLGIMVDSIFHLIAVFVGIFVLFGAGLITEETASSLDMFVDPIVLAVLFVPVLFQWALLWTRSQTIGKVVLKTRIYEARADEPAGPGRTIGLRYIPVMLVSALPLGFIFSLIDGLMIFAGSERQCVHDKIAGTVVRKVG